MESHDDLARKIAAEMLRVKGDEAKKHLYEKVLFPILLARLVEKDLAKRNLKKDTCEKGKLKSTKGRFCTLYRYAY